MQTIMLIMRRRPVAQAFMKKLAGSTDASIVCESDYTRAEHSIRKNNARAALVEVTEAGDYDAVHCLALCDRLRKNAPDCKLVLLCPEQDEPGVFQAVKAKKDGRIDDFVFYDASLDYLASKLLSML